MIAHSQQKIKDYIKQENDENQENIYENNIVKKIHFSNDQMPQNQIKKETIILQQTPENKQESSNYYQEYCRLFIANMVLCSHLKELQSEKQELLLRLQKLEKKSDELGQLAEDDRKKRFRRTAQMIERHFICPIETCKKSYGSEGSLNQHIKLKHPELAGKQFEFQQQQSNSQQQLDSSQNNYSESEQEENQSGKMEMLHTSH